MYFLGWDNDMTIILNHVWTFQIGSAKNEEDAMEDINNDIQEGELQDLEIVDLDSPDNYSDETKGKLPLKIRRSHQSVATQTTWVFTWTK